MKIYELLLAGYRIKPEHLPSRITSKFSVGSNNSPSKSSFQLLPLKDIEKQVIQKGLEYFGSSKKAKALLAKELGIGRSTLYRKLKEFDID